MIRLLLTSGRGPAECRIALAGILQRLLAEASALGLDADAVQGRNEDGHGPQSAIVSIAGHGCETFARSWTGTIQWIAPSPLRANHGRKNWFIGINQLPMPAMRPSALREHDVRFETFAAGGPGGQHQNKTESAVRAIHKPSGRSVVARSERSQHRNKALAMERLAEMLALGAELGVVAEREREHTSHRGLERGCAVRRFKGSEFKPLSMTGSPPHPPKTGPQRKIFPDRTPVAAKIRP